MGSQYARFFTLFDRGVKSRLHDSDVKRGVRGFGNTWIVRVPDFECFQLMHWNTTIMSATPNGCEYFAKPSTTYTTRVRFQEFAERALFVAQSKGVTHYYAQTGDDRVFVPCYAPLFIPTECSSVLARLHVFADEGLEKGLLAPFPRKKGFRLA